ncbi:MAG TPA: SseB family protein, partial [Mycobacteriales bacterium]|nr:SseB family protein [Mycobacteriales bacterium]
ADADDRGEPDAELVAALAADDRSRIHTRLPHARLLVPVVALPGAGEADMAVPTLVNAAGRRGLPVFTGTAALAEWRADARPVPMAGSRVIAAAVEEKYDGLVIDVAGPVTFILEPDELRLLAQRTAPRPDGC